MLDDFFPNLLSSFRVAEYNWYLERFPRLKIYSTTPDFNTVHSAYAQRYPQHADRVKPYDESSLDDCAFAYINFLNNVHNFLPALSSNCIPFLMTLYPGGGFGLGEPESDAKLDKILESPLLRGIIATQSVTLDYLKAKGCKVPVHYIYGGSIHPIYFEGITKEKDILLNTNSKNICFVGARYMPQGANKGYPQFIEAAKQLIREFPDLRFSVVGNFDAEDVPLDDKIRPTISFKGPLTTHKLKEFFFTQDIIVSPNRPFLLHPGNFDGFPTGCCVEASLCGVAIVCSDELKLNSHYTDGVDIVICNPTAASIIKAVKELIHDPVLLKSISAHGRSISQKIFDPKKQLVERSALLGDAIESTEAKWPIKLVEHFKMTEKILAQKASNIRGIDTGLTARGQHIEALEKNIADLTNHIRNVEADWIARGQHIEALEKNIADLTNHIRNVEADWIARGQHIKALEENIADLTNHIRNVEADWVARGQHIEALEKNIADLTNHIRNIHAEITKYQLSWYGKLKSANQKLHQLIK